MKRFLIAIVLLACTHALLAGGEHSGQVTFGELPVPGATVTATNLEVGLTRTVVTAANGRYRR